MRPKLLHWHVIGWVDADPEVALCLNVRRMEFYFPEGSRVSGKQRRVDTVDGQEQVLQVIGVTDIPKIPHYWKGHRINA